MTLLHDDGTRPDLPSSVGESVETTLTVAFGGLRLEQSDDVLPARPWTAAQSRWAAHLARTLDDGPALELYAGAGQIGLELARLTGRPVVQVDASAEACRLARRNADRNGLGHLVVVRHQPVAVTLRPPRPFALVLADPPYVPTSDVDRYPDDPRHAIDGGPDGLGHLRELLRVLPRYLTPTTPVLVQLRGSPQADRLRELIVDQEVPVEVAEVRSYGPDRAVALLLPR
jgi:release factor glutamine methyltransferase